MSLGNCLILNNNWLTKYDSVRLDDVPQVDRERFVININFGSHKVVKEIDLPAAKPEVIEHDEEAEADEF